MADKEKRRDTVSLLLPGRKAVESTPMDLYFTGVKLPKPY